MNNFILIAIFAVFAKEYCRETVCTCLLNFLLKYLIEILGILLLTQVINGKLL